MYRALAYFSLAGFIMALLSFMILAVFFPFTLSLIIACLLGTIFGLFSLGFMQRTLPSQTLEINSGNKDPEKPMRWYEERVREQINDMRFIFKEVHEGTEVFKPRALYRVFEPNIYLETSPFEITVRASRLMIRLISTYVEIEAQPD